MADRKKGKEEELPVPSNEVPIEIADEMKSCYIDYAMSVIVGRALPDARDGLKPVHRRILYSMNEQSMVFGKPYKKSARVVGDVLGKYHPHGDIAIYESLVRMAQDFSLRYPLIDGQGNFGSVDGDGAAAMRYTEARTSKIAAEMLEDIDKDTVDFVPNFDESTQEPVVLPSRLPNLLLNGSSGIAVGMATNIPPHNLEELVNGIAALVEDPELSNKQLMKYVKGPDFPTGAIICGTDEIKRCYETGKGSLVLRSQVSIEEYKKDRQAIIVHEIPYQVNKASLIVRIADLVQEKKIVGISDLRDESGRDGLRIFIEIKRGANAQVVLNQLFKLSPLQTTYSCNLLALIDGEPKLCDLKTLLQVFINFRVEVITKRTQFDLKKAEERSHILEGLLIALESLDAVIQLIRKSKDVDTAREGLIKNFKLTEIQSQAILDMRLQRLTALESQKVKDEHKQLKEVIKDLKDILANKKRIHTLIKEESKKLIEVHGDKRKTQIQSAEVEEVQTEELIPNDEVAVFITLQGYVKRLPVITFRNQMRGGRGVSGMATRDTDVINQIYITHTHATLLCFTNFGKAYGFKVYDIPDASRTSKGQSITMFLDKMASGERVTSAIAVDKFDPKQFLMMVTQKGVIKKTALDEFDSPRKSGIIAITLDDGDELLQAQLSSGAQEILLGTHEGQVLRFKEEDVRPMGRSARGVRGMNLEEADRVISMEKIDNPKNEVLIVSEKGLGKRIDLSEFPTHSRGGKGVKAMNIKPERTGMLSKFLVVEADDEVMFVSSNGTVSKQAVKNISKQHRQSTGVIIQRMSTPSEKVVDLAKVLKATEED